MPRSPSPRPARTSERPILFIATSDISLEAFHEGQLRHFREMGLGPIEAASRDTGVLAGVGRRESIVTHALPLTRDPSPFHDLRGLISIVGLLLRRRPRMVVYETPKACFLTAIAATIVRVPVRVQILHGLRLETTSGFLRRALLFGERLNLRLSTTTISVSHALCERAGELGLDSSRIEVLGSGSINGVDLARFDRGREARAGFRRSIGADDHENLVGFVGRITRDKGIDALVAAVKRMRANGTLARLVLVGAAENLSSLQPETRAALEESWIVSTGVIDDPSAAFAGFDVACLPSHREGLGSVVLEAWAARTPVVVSEAPSLRRLVGDDSAGLAVDIDDVAALASALTRCLEGGPATDARVARGREYAEEQFDRTVVSRRWTERLLELEDQQRSVS